MDGSSSSDQARCKSAGAESTRTDSTWRTTVLGSDPLGKGAVLFTGPDGIRDHRVRVDAEHSYVGEGTMSPEGTSGVRYLWRAPYSVPHPRPKSHCVGEIGWGIPTHTDWSAPRTGAQTQLGEFRQAVEDRQTHLFQNAWYPGPNDVIPSQSDAALVMNVYKSSKNPSSRPQQAGTRGNSTGSRRSSNYSDESFCGSERNVNNNSIYHARPLTGRRYHSLMCQQY